MKKALFITLAVLCLSIPHSRAQDSNSRSRYAAIKETALVATAEKVTIQQPAAISREIHLEYADVYCSVACTATFSQYGSVATATSLTVTALNGSPAGAAVAFSSSNASGGTGKTFYIAAGQTASFDIGMFTLPRSSGSTVANFSIATNSITGTARIQIQWTEQP